MIKILAVIILSLFKNRKIILFLLLIWSLWKLKTIIAINSDQEEESKSKSESMVMMTTMTEVELEDYLSDQQLSEQFRSMGYPYVRDMSNMDAQLARLLKWKSKMYINETSSTVQVVPYEEDDVTGLLS